MANGHGSVKNEATMNGWCSPFENANDDKSLECKEEAVDGDEMVKSNGTVSTKEGKDVKSESSDPKSYFKLGMEGDYVNYKNQYTSNPLAISKHDHQVERDKKRSLGNKFRLYDFKWNGECYEGTALLINVLRSAFISFESSIPTPFLHPMWYKMLPCWLKAVRLCKEPEQFAAILLALEEVIKPLVMLNVWRDTVGNVLLRRGQSEVKSKSKSKKEKDLETIDDNSDSDDDEDHTDRKPCLHFSTLNECNILCYKSVGTYCFRGVILNC